MNTSRWHRSPLLLCSAEDVNNNDDVRRRRRRIEHIFPQTLMSAYHPSLLSTFRVLCSRTINIHPVSKRVANTSDVQIKVVHLKRIFHVPQSAICREDEREGEKKVHAKSIKCEDNKEQSVSTSSQTFWPIVFVSFLIYVSLNIQNLKC